jgi:hypothetical protein
MSARDLKEHGYLNLFFLLRWLHLKFWS